MAYYKDLREYLDALEKDGKLVKISRAINKDTELSSLVRLQFRGLPEEQRKAFLFENVYDAKGKHYGIPVAVGILGASADVYALGLACEKDQINDKWIEAQVSPIEPEMVESGPVHEEIHVGDTLLEHGGFGEFPVPISTPGWDIAPFLASPYWVTKDPETGVRNIGTYRAQIKSPAKAGIIPSKPTRGIAYHWRKAYAKGQPLEAAIIIGAPPNIGYVSVSTLPVGVDEYTVAGGLAGEAVKLVKCKTVDLEVPANAEIVIEGKIAIDGLEPEAPFGEATGYMGQQEMAPYFIVQCITHRKNPIYQTFLSQFPPSESSVIKQIGWENNIYKFLHYDLKHECVKNVAVHCSNGSDRYAVIQVKRFTDSSSIWDILAAVPKKFPAFSKIITVVDEDINPWDANMVNWAVTFRCQPHRDIKIVKSPAPDFMDFSLTPPGDALHRDHRIEAEEMPESSRLLIDATMKWPYPPISLPKKQYMDRAITLWNELGLPSLDLKEPWYGYNLGYWSEEDEEFADLALKGEHYKIGEILSQRKRTF